MSKVAPSRWAPCAIGAVAWQAGGGEFSTTFRLTQRSRALKPCPRKSFRLRTVPAGDLPALAPGDKMSESDSHAKQVERAKAAEKARLAAALRANLQRRKAQARGRSVPAGDSAPMDEGAAPRED
jgi:hypothetical protein